MKVTGFLLCICLPALLSQASFGQADSSRGKEGKRPIDKVLQGTASFYGEPFRGKKTHSDELFDPDKLTAACNVLPLKTWVIVTNLRNHKRVVLWINDRMHPKNKRLIDVSARAARDLGFYARGLTKVRVEVVTADRARNVQDSLTEHSMLSPEQLKASTDSTKSRQ